MDPGQTFAGCFPPSGRAACRCCRGQCPGAAVRNSRLLMPGLRTGVHVSSATARSCRSWSWQCGPPRAIALGVDRHRFDHLSHSPSCFVRSVVNRLSADHALSWSIWNTISRAARRACLDIRNCPRSVCQGRYLSARGVRQSSPGAMSVTTTSTPYTLASTTCGWRTRSMPPATSWTQWGTRPHRASADTRSTNGKSRYASSARD